MTTSDVCKLVFLCCFWTSCFFARCNKMMTWTHWKRVSLTSPNRTLSIPSPWSSLRAVRKFTNHSFINSKFSFPIDPDPSKITTRSSKTEIQKVTTWCFRRQEIFLWNTRAYTCLFRESFDAYYELAVTFSSTISHWLDIHVMPWNFNVNVV